MQFKMRGQAENCVYADMHFLFYAVTAELVCKIFTEISLY